MVSGFLVLCVMYVNLCVFGELFDLVVLGINLGSNVGRLVYYLGIVGAVLMVCNGGISGVVVS